MIWLLTLAAVLAAVPFGFLAVAGWIGTITWAFGKISNAIDRRLS